ncbi:VPS10 domain-containing receptor SorCS1, partial [Goodea atripinnis]
MTKPFYVPKKALRFLFNFFIFCSFKIMLLTDPEVESSLLISSDEGATYQKYRLNFYILSLLFHPEQEDWILAYSHDQKVREWHAYSFIKRGRASTATEVIQ